MNNNTTHIPEEIVKRWPGYEFQGKSIKLSDGKTYIRAYSKCFKQIHFYCFQEDFFWHEKPLIIPKTPKKEKSLIEV